MSDSRTFRRSRWWPAFLILGLVLLGLAAVWIPDRPNRQDQVLLTAPILFFGGLLLGMWFLFFSRLRGTVRLVGLGLVVLLGAASAASLRFRGVSGDLVPLVEWRWSGATVPAAPTGDVSALSSTLLASPSYPQFLGPSRDGIVRDVRLARDWDASPPVELWRRPLGRGWSGFAVADGRAVTQEQRDGQETVSCYELTTGRPLWSHGAALRHEDPLGGPGPRATPSIVDGLVYTLGGTGVLHALDLADGHVLWSRDVLLDHGAVLPTYGVSASPLVLEDRVIVLAGGAAGHSLVAYDRLTGEPSWSGGDDPAAYSSPVLLRLAGEDQIVVLNQIHLAGHSPVDGRVLWSVVWDGATEKVSQPVALGEDRVFLSTGYGVGGRLFEIRRGPGPTFSVELVWESRALKAKMTDVVERDGYLYGLDDGILACVDTATGERRWKRGRYGHGQVILVDDLLLVQAESGDVALVEASPDAFRELGRMRGLAGKTWNHPALAGPYLLLRNDREAACFRLPLVPDGTTAP